VIDVSQDSSHQYAVAVSDKAFDIPDTSLIDEALCSRDDEAPWTVAWGRLPTGVEIAGLHAVFRNGRKSQPAARIGVLGRHWAAEVAGRFDKVEVTFAGTPQSRKVRVREKAPETRRARRKAGAAGVSAPADALDEMKRHWGLAGLILQPGGVELSELPDLRIADRQPQRR
jgi:hypothetical protein